MIHGETDKINPNDPPTPAEQGRIEEAATLLNQYMDDLEFEDETAWINLYFKKIGLHEFMEF